MLACFTLLLLAGALSGVAKRDWARLAICLLLSVIFGGAGAFFYFEFPHEKFMENVLAEILGVAVLVGLAWVGGRLFSRKPAEPPDL